MKIRTLSAMFCLGGFSALAQVLLMREFLVVFLGNELVVGAILAAWFLGIGLGALSFRAVGGLISRTSAIQAFLAVLFACLAFLLPVQVCVVRVARTLLNVGPGTDAAFGQVMGTVILVLVPVCWCAGVIFPFACRLSAGAGSSGRAARPESTVSAVYAAESAGGMVFGVALTYFLLPYLAPLRIVLCGTFIALLGAAVMAPGRAWKIVAATVAVGIVLAASVRPGPLDAAGRMMSVLRWRSFGALGSCGSNGVRLVAETDTVYQNLAVTEMAGQYTLYANGRVVFDFPDPYTYAGDVHFMMAQNPGARRILLLGGNPADEIPMLLRYPVDRLVYVNLDPGIYRVMRAAAPGLIDAAFRDSRVERVICDAPRFVQMCNEKFDLVIVNAPEPATAAANRFYTLEFYENIRRVLADTGYMYTSAQSSERLQSEAVELGGSVYATLRRAFPVVLVTAESRNRFFAGFERSALTLDGRDLFRRSSGSGVDFGRFDPRYFLTADMILPEKREFVERRFAVADAALNTNLDPVTYFHNLMLWGRIGGSAINSFLHAAQSLDVFGLILCMASAGILCLVVGRVCATRRPGGCAGWSRPMFVVMIATTGLCAMGMEILLVFVFQGLYGYVYTRMGLIVAVFMSGLVLGAPAGRFLASRPPAQARLSACGLDLALVLLALGVPVLAAFAARPGLSGFAAGAAEFGMYSVVGLVACVVGAQFPVANRLYVDSGSCIETGASVTDSADHLGAAVGGIVTGVILVPVLGAGMTCAVMAALKCASLLCLVSGLIAMPIRPE